MKLLEFVRWSASPLALQVLRPRVGPRGAARSAIVALMRLPQGPHHDLALRRTDVSFEGLRHPVATLEAARVDDVLETVIDEDHVYAARLWPSSFVAARTLLRHLETEREAVVCEIGCGPGLPSLAALAAGARSVIAVDMSPLALGLVSHAARSYQPTRAPRLTTVQRNLLQSDGETPVHCDYLVVADLLYDLPTAQAVGRYVGRHVRRGGGTAIIADPGRMNGKGRAAFARGLVQSDCISAVGSPRARFTEEGLPRRWRGVQKDATMGVLVLEPEREV